MKKWAKKGNNKTEEKIFRAENHWRVERKKIAHIDRQFITNTLFLVFHDTMLESLVISLCCVFWLYFEWHSLLQLELELTLSLYVTAARVSAGEIKSGRKTCDIRSYFAYNLVTFLSYLEIWIYSVWCTFLCDLFLVCISSDCASRTNVLFIITIVVFPLPKFVQTIKCANFMPEFTFYLISKAFYLFVDGFWLRSSWEDGQAQPISYACALCTPICGWLLLLLRMCERELHNLRHFGEWNASTT